MCCQKMKAVCSFFHAVQRKSAAHSVHFGQLFLGRKFLCECSNFHVDRLASFRWFPPTTAAYSWEFTFVDHDPPPPSF